MNYDLQALRILCDSPCAKSTRLEWLEPTIGAAESDSNSWEETLVEHASAWPCGKYAVG